MFEGEKAMSVLNLKPGCEDYQMEEQCDGLVASSCKKEVPVRIGIDIGGTQTKIGLVDVHRKLIASETIDTNAKRPAGELIHEIAQKTLEFLDVQKIEMDQCVGVGIGVPGTVDAKNGVVRYSNNIKWENVELAKEMGKYIPIPVKIANDADCATLGEAVAGAGKECQDVIMLTLGTGVGGGIIIDGKLFEGKRLGGSEIGHMVIVENGEPCTCGRRGCLEAYASATALKRDAKRATGKNLTPIEIFNGAREGNEKLEQVVQSYIGKLGTGIINIVNIFRPQLVILGGGISAQGEILLEPLRKMMKVGCFGGERGELPEIKTAALGNKAGMIGAASLL